MMSWSACCGLAATGLATSASDAPDVGAQWLPWMLLAAIVLAGPCVVTWLHHRHQARCRGLEGELTEVRGMLDAMDIAVLSVDREGVVRYINAAARDLLQLPSQPLSGQTLSDLSVDEAVSTFVKEARARDGAHRDERALAGNPGCEVVMLSEPVHSAAAGDIVLVLDDVTRLRRLESVRSDFAANVSHELRTPITAIQGYAELLVEQPGPADHAEVILRNARRLSNIIEDLLALARLEDSAQAQALVLSSVAIHDLLDAVARASEEEAQQEGVSLSVDCDDLLVCNGSRPLLEQAIGNLVTNAIRYGGGGSTVKLEARRVDPDLAAINVIDHGPGISDEHHARVFERFYRIDRGRSRQVGGTGLGLAIVKHIALAHGGSVSLSATPGGGCTFSLLLPLDDDTSE
ncbi:MAG: ATP-binding protein [Phycisphaerales bacterium]|nr:ATP-binding protein [Phycisphaerales bacterium]